MAMAYVKCYALPIDGATLSKPVLLLLPLGPLGPLLIILVTTYARFSLRQNFAGTWFAILHAGRSADAKG